MWRDVADIRTDLAWFEAEVRSRSRVEQGAAHLFDHVDRVRRLALRIGRSEAGTDLGVLEAAALLHDIGRLDLWPPKEGHAERGAQVAAGLLAQRGWPPEQIEAVAHAIRAHSWSAGREPVSLEARILRDADRLDALGAIGIARVLVHDGRRALYAPADPLGEQRPPDETFVLDHFRAKILRLKDGLHTRAARRLAEERHAVVTAFLAQLQREIELADWGEPG